MKIVRECIRLPIVSDVVSNKLTAPNEELNHTLSGWNLYVGLNQHTEIRFCYDSDNVLCF